MLFLTLKATALDSGELSLGSACSLDGTESSLTQINVLFPSVTRVCTSSLKMW